MRRTRVRQPLALSRRGCLRRPAHAVKPCRSGVREAFQELFPQTRATLHHDRSELPVSGVNNRRNHLWISLKIESVWAWPGDSCISNESVGDGRTCASCPPGLARAGHYGHF